MRVYDAIVSLLACLGLYACGSADSAPAHGASGPLFRVSILGDSTDPRIPYVHEAIDHWNAEFARLGLNVRLDSGTVVHGPLPEKELRAASESRAMPWSVLADTRLRSALRDVPGDITIALSHTDLISFSVPWNNGHRGIAGIRRSDTLPLSLPNTVRNVVAHELGHVLGLPHNTDSTTLMCGRPASCRPAAFSSQTAHFFPLTQRDEQTLRQRWR